MSINRRLTYVEIETPEWVDGSPSTTRVWRFAMGADFRPRSIEAIPSLLSVEISPATVSLGRNLGQRAQVSCVFRDHRHIMNGEDFDSGTFWGKFRARYGLRLRGRPLRVIQGHVGQTLAEMSTAHFILESCDGPSPDGRYTITARDALKAADGDRALAPNTNTGFLVADIDDVTTAATLSPAGIGDFEYPASGWVCIGGQEICEFTRSGDVLTLTRGQLGTEAQEHSAEDRVQLVLRYIAADPADIIHDLFTTYAGVDPSYIDLPAWQSETFAFFSRLLTAIIPEPTPVNVLISEIIEQAALAVWWDEYARRIELRVLRPIVTDAEQFGDKQIMQNTLSTQDQLGERVSQVWTYYAPRNPTRPLSELSNYRSVAVTADLEAETDFGAAAIRRIYSRWIPEFGRAIATRLNNIVLGRFVDPPRRIVFSLSPLVSSGVTLGAGYRLGWWANQDETGQRVLAPIQTVRVARRPDRIDVVAEEMLFTNFDPGQDLNRVITIDTNSRNLDLLQIHNNQFSPVDPDASPAVTVTFIIPVGVRVGSSLPSLPAIRTGVWPAGFVPRLEVLGRIQGAGGDAGRTGRVSGSSQAENGGTALLVESPIDLVDELGEIWGGGGGGSAVLIDPAFPSNPLSWTATGAGGGQGDLPGLSGATTEAPGGDGSADPGQGIGGTPGASGGGLRPGAGGASIVGVSMVTTIGPAGDRRGSQTG